jgi:hypothetical protein
MKNKMLQKYQTALDDLPHTSSAEISLNQKQAQLRYTIILARIPGFLGFPQ